MATRGHCGNSTLYPRPPSYNPLRPLHDSEGAREEECPWQLLRPTRPTGETRHSTARRGTAATPSGAPAHFQGARPLSRSPRSCRWEPGPAAVKTCLALAQKTQQASGQLLHSQESHRLQSPAAGVGSFALAQNTGRWGPGSAPPCRSSATVQERDLTLHKCLAASLSRSGLRGFRLSAYIRDPLS